MDRADSLEAKHEKKNKEEKFSDYSVLTAGQRDPLLGKTIKEIIRGDADFIVYLDTDGVIQWSTLDGHSYFAKDFNKRQAEISRLEIICNNVFARRDAYDYKSFLAEAYVCMLEDSGARSAEEIIDEARQAIESHGAEVLRRDYLMAGLWLTGGLGLVLLFAVFWVGKIWPITHMRNVFNIYLSGLMGGIGGFTSMMITAKNYVPRIESGRAMHVLDGFIRVVYGVVAGALVGLGMKADVVFGFAGGAAGNIYVLTFLAAIGGASQSILPSIIKQVEEKA